ncbi:uncharacterized protein V1518DRAFT_414922 [Limtongia smithiae]|uniref:uncharacterized protein n=1 Tax=Limtongia smithiae TaxID=1125753 RepID=UPI0034CDA2A4
MKAQGSINEALRKAPMRRTAGINRRHDHDDDNVAVPSIFDDVTPPPITKNATSAEQTSAAKEAKLVLSTKAAAPRFPDPLALTQRPYGMFTAGTALGFFAASIFPEASACIRRVVDRFLYGVVILLMWGVVFLAGSLYYFRDARKRSGTKLEWEAQISRILKLFAPGEALFTNAQAVAAHLDNAATTAATPAAVANPTKTKSPATTKKVKSVQDAAKPYPAYSDGTEQSLTPLEALAKRQKALKPDSASPAVTRHDSMGSQKSSLHSVLSKAHSVPSSLSLPSLPEIVSTLPNGTEATPRTARRTVSSNGFTPAPDSSRSYDDAKLATTFLPDSVTREKFVTVRTLPRVSTNYTFKDVISECSPTVVKATAPGRDPNQFPLVAAFVRSDENELPVKFCGSGLALRITMQGLVLTDDNGSKGGDLKADMIALIEYDFKTMSIMRATTQTWPPIQITYIFHKESTLKATVGLRSLKRELRLHGVDVKEMDGQAILAAISSS